MVATSSRVRVPRNIAGVAVDEGMDGLALLAQARRVRQMADRLEVQAIESFRRANGSAELASKQIDAGVRAGLAGVA